MKVWSAFTKYFYQEIADYFDRVLASEKWHHAYLFTGKNESGLGRVAREAALTFILHGLDDDYGSKVQWQFEKGSYSDFYVLEREYDQKNKKLNQNISIEQVRDLREKLSQKSFLNLPKVVLIKDAELLNTDSANALLKILEEPPARTMFFMLANTREQVLPTLLSRSQSFSFKSQPLALIKQYLLDVYQLNHELAENIAHLSAGLPERAVQYCENREIYENYLEKVDQTLKLFEDFYADRFTAMQSMIMEKAKDYNSQKALALLLLDLLEIVFRDMLLIKNDLKHLIYLMPRSARLRDLAQKYDLAALHQFLKKIQDARLSLAKNVNLALTLENLLINF
jgi:DNA polymerase-3 subunit delta'